MKNITFYLLLVWLVTGCSGTKRSTQKSTDKIFGSAFFENQFTGLFVVNPQNGDTLMNFNGKKYFTPASNTKIVTLYTAKTLLSDSIPALKYVAQNDTLYIEGTGDPTLLHSYFDNNRTVEFLKQYPNIVLNLDNFQEEKFGPGWAWDDYGYYYQAEISSFPIYGNVITLRKANKMTITPSYFQDSVVPVAYKVNRELEQNLFYFPTYRNDTIEIPFKTGRTVIKQLLEEVLQSEILLSDKMPTGEKKTLYSVPSDTVFKRMMHESDNFLAEQLLLLSSSTFTDTLSGDKAREWILENKLADLKQPPRWVDGSGLSRYNLFTPESIVSVLNKMYTEIPREELFDYFPSGGISGNFDNGYRGKKDPYIYAKSGSLGNVSCLSGYLLTTSGKTLIFSFMNNHFRRPSSEIKTRMQQILEDIRATY